MGSGVNLLEAQSCQILKAGQDMAWLVPRRETARECQEAGVSEWLVMVGESASADLCCRSSVSLPLGKLVASHYNEKSTSLV